MQNEAFDNSNKSFCWKRGLPLCGHLFCIPVAMNELYTQPCVQTFLPRYFRIDTLGKIDMHINKKHIAITDNNTFI